MTGQGIVNVVGYAFFGIVATLVCLSIGAMVVPRGWGDTTLGGLRVYLRSLRPRSLKRRRRSTRKGGSR